MEKEVVKQDNKTEGRDEILVAALNLFAEKGYFNTSLSDIKDQIGAKSTSSISRYFKTKQTIASELYNSILDNLNISIDDIRRRNKKVVDQLREIVDLLFTLTEEAPEIIRFLLILNIPEFLPEEKPIYESKPFQKIQRIIQAGIKSGEIRSLEPAIIFSQFFGIIFQTLVMIITGSFKKKSDSYQASAWAAAWNGIAKV
jgi:AcrR family transcriptional regulator